MSLWRWSKKSWSIWTPNIGNKLQTRETYTLSSRTTSSSSIEKTEKYLLKPFSIKAPTFDLFRVKQKSTINFMDLHYIPRALQTFPKSIGTRKTTIAVRARNKITVFLSCFTHPTNSLWLNRAHCCSIIAVKQFAVENKLWSGYSKGGFICEEGFFTTSVPGAVWWYKYPFVVRRSSKYQVP